MGNGDVKRNDKFRSFVSRNKKRNSNFYSFSNDAGMCYAWMDVKKTK